MSTLAANEIDEDEIPLQFNAAAFFLDRHVDSGRGEHTAVIDDQGRYSYRELSLRSNQVANALGQLGLKPEARIALAVLDCVEFVDLFWGAIKAGIVPVCLNTLLTSEHYYYIVADSRVRVLLVSAALLDQFRPILATLPHLEQVIVVGDDEYEFPKFNDWVSGQSEQFECAKTHRDDVAFWLYSSGSTGNPKGVLHRHSSLYWSARLYGRDVLGIQSTDIVYSAAKLFFAYGLGNGMSFPFLVGATTVLFAPRPTPDAVMDCLKRNNVSIFYGVPTLYAALLASPDSAAQEHLSLRICVSAGEALPEELGKRWQQRFDVDILDGVGSTEMLHIYLSNRPGNVRYGSSGTPVPGYQARLVDDQDHNVADGEIGELLINGLTAPNQYWAQRKKSVETFIGSWTRTGDKYTRDEQGFYYYCGRSDDMFKSGGNWVSPFEVESALIAHEKVLEAAVIARADAHENLKPMAYVILKEGIEANDDLNEELRSFVKSRLELWKHPRWIEFREHFPKTATGKIQRYKLRTPS